MKRKKYSYDTLEEENKDTRFSNVVIALLLIGLIGYLLPDMIQFKVTKEVCSTDYDAKNNQTTSFCYEEEVKDRVIDFCYAEDDCGKIKVGTSIWKEDWLDENCVCRSDKECTIHYNWSQVYRDYIDKGGGTYDGPIEVTESGQVIFFEKGAQVIEECSMCEEYSCNNYVVKVIK